MNSRARLAILLVSAPIVLLVVLGGFLSKAAAREESYQHLRVFEDVVSLVLNNYVEEVKTDRIMGGAMHGLAEGLDPDSAYLTPQQVAAMAKPDPSAKGSVGLELTRQYYLRVLAARDGSPAAKAGLRPGDFIRAIDDKPTRDMSVLIGSRMLSGAPGSKVTLTVIRGNAAEPHAVELVREEPRPSVVSYQMVRPGVALVRVPAFSPQTVEQLRTQIADARKAGGDRVLIDLRGTAEGAIDDGVAAARLFVSKGVLTSKESRQGKIPVEAQPGDGAIDAPSTLLLDNGTAGAAEVFAAALAGNGRAVLIGEHTIGRAAIQELVKLPDGSALWMSTSRYLTPKDVTIHEKGLVPDVAVEAPDVEFGSEAPSTDPILEKAIEQVTHKAAA
jgi:carboxyl-terminal processing protease